ncbi:hypothetical protein SISSUDRAFT_856613 [Sistotremastrum suecicum HHB10207 ss-3]|uniref:Uncharacterized protein n=1 Tax=Sistotremastrum suecicum HHB10207 ss-3 TaxID=1314776 RepID=A0A166CHI3_9AGAM|nr:hypothetical protein SISSUDRAFT_856613 [Sistotremastrum suecicum HHB10207 ss-3]
MRIGSLSGMRAVGWGAIHSSWHIIYASTLHFSLQPSTLRPENRRNSPAQARRIIVLPGSRSPGPGTLQPISAALPSWLIRRSPAEVIVTVSWPGLQGLSISPGTPKDPGTALCSALTHAIYVPGSTKYSTRVTLCRPAYCLHSSVWRSHGTRIHTPKPNSPRPVFSDQHHQASHSIFSGSHTAFARSNRHEFISLQTPINPSPV